MRTSAPTITVILIPGGGAEHVPGKLSHCCSVLLAGAAQRREAEPSGEGAFSGNVMETQGEGRTHGCWGPGWSRTCRLSPWPSALGRACPPTPTYRGVEAVRSSRDSLLILIDRPLNVSRPEHAVLAQGGEAVSEGTAAEHLPCLLPQRRRHRPTQHSFPGAGATSRQGWNTGAAFSTAAGAPKMNAFHSQKMCASLPKGKNYPSMIRAFVIF